MQAPAHREPARPTGISTGQLVKSKLEIADIFQRYDPAWRRANGGHINLSQLKVMFSIEACRTEALGGRVAACIKCDHPAARQHMLACVRAGILRTTRARTGAALNVRDRRRAIGWRLGPKTCCLWQYFHLVFTQPAEIARIAHWNKKAIYGLLFRASAQTVSTIAADPKRLGASGDDQRAAYLGVSFDPSHRTST